MTPNRWFILADDLTGAADTAGAFRRAGYRALLRLSASGEEAEDAEGENWDVIAYDADLREHPDGDEMIPRRIREAVKTFSDGRQVYLKIDSTLRGPVRSLYREVLSALGHPSEHTIELKSLASLICPAFPAQGRVTRGEMQYAHGKPVAWMNSDGSSERDLRRLFAVDEADAFHLSPGHLSKVAANRSSVSPILIIDAETDEDLRAIAREGETLSPALWVGSAGLAGAIAKLNPQSTPPPSLPEVERVIVVSGSAHPRTHDQLDHLEAADTAKRSNYYTFQAVRENETGLHPRCAESVIINAINGIDDGIPTGWVLTGGWTARRFLLSCGVNSLELGGEVAEGIPWMIARNGLLKGSPVITKSGGFGGPDALEQAIHWLL